jgi:hypothetical protein
MELDNLKELVDTSASNYKPVNRDIMELISRNSQGPLTLLGKKLKMGLLLFPLTVILFLAVFIGNSGALHSSVMWILLIILLIEFINNMFNYGIVKKMQEPTGNTKHNLFLKLSRLEKSFNLHFALNLLLYIIMAVMLEISMSVNSESNFEGWYTLPLLLRVACYIGFLIIQFFLKKYSYKKLFGQHIVELKRLVQQLE